MPLTIPVSAHAIARASYLKREHLATPGAIDETGQLLDLAQPESDEKF
ncbi:MAG: monovalent cation/H(+) antiporter subunit G [Chloroflexaceae bacterium]|nr:monovalent cation/H(+) antiporter subunit G [Chloroflexaceae bacterium]NJL32862.1 monovalent cation/H(+) antiporter subunit G [Chloroflexaceae bacterium]NJO06984.1 monovalent cation/H(+) antiporter subunit G [Chloroflexaceae bacterium]